VQAHKNWRTAPEDGGCVRWRLEAYTQKAAEAEEVALAGEMRCERCWRHGGSEGGKITRSGTGRQREDAPHGAGHRQGSGSMAMDGSTGKKRS
jgi:hypothetical protein